MNLYENFNTSNQTKPEAQRHQNFVIDLRPPGCLAVQVLPAEGRCGFVKSTPECNTNAQFLNYNYIHYCVIGSKNVGYSILGFAFMIFSCLYLFYFTSSVSERFFCPSVTVLRNRFGISEHIAGLTIVAYGNHLPDLIKNVLLIDEDLSTLYSEIMGSSVFISIFVGGLIIWMKPFHIDGLLFARDIAFHILAINYLDFVNKSHSTVSIYESGLMIGLYIFYTIVIVIDNILIRRSRRYWRKLSIVSKFAFLKPSSPTADALSTSLPPSAQRSLMKTTYESLIPFTYDMWRAGGYLSKAWLAFKFPVDIILNLMLPIVNHDLPLSGWSRLVNCVQIITFPLMVLYISGFNRIVFGYRIEYWFLIATVPTACIIFCVTSTNQKPKFHTVVGVFSIIGALYIMKAVSKELKNIGDLLGYVTYSTQSFLGVTILIWGNCAGVIAALIVFVRQGQQKMAYASTIGGPIFGSTISIGIIYLYKCLQSPTMQTSISLGSMGENCTVFQILYLFVILLGGAVTNFKLRKSLGWYSIIYYLLFFVFCFLGELEYIHPFGTNHAEDYGADFL